MSEEWRSVDGWPYEVSDQGRVRNVRTGKVLKPDVNEFDQERVRLYRPDGQQRFFVHHLVLEAFVGFRPNGCETNHRDGNRRNNDVENLEWVTPQENVRHAIREGMRSQVRGEDVGGSKLTESEVVEIRERYFSGGVSQKQLGDEYGIRQPGVSRILNGQRWSHVGGPTGVIVRGPLTPDQIRDIYRRAHRGNESYRDIGDDYDVGKSTVSQIKTGRSHSRITGHEAT